MYNFYPETKASRVRGIREKYKNSFFFEIPMHISSTLLGRTKKDALNSPHKLVNLSPSDHLRNCNSFGLSKPWNAFSCVLFCTSLIRKSFVRRPTSQGSTTNNWWKPHSNWTNTFVLPMANPCQSVKRLDCFGYITLESFVNIFAQKP